MRRPVKEAQIESCQLFLECERSFQPLTPCEPSDFIYETDGVIRVIDDADDCDGQAGRFEVAYLDVELAEKASIGLFDIFDAHHYTCEFYEAICGPDERMSPSLGKLLGDCDYYVENVLILKRLELLPPFRRRGVGLLAMRNMINRFSLGASLVAIKIFPLQFECHEPGKDGGWRQKLRLHDFERDEQTAALKLRKYYSRLGFRALPGTPFMFLWATRKLPKSSTILTERTAVAIR
jgi:hypothetical protein